MTYRKVWDARVTFNNVLRDRSNGKKYLYPVKLGENGYADLADARPKPTPLTATGMVVHKTILTQGGTGYSWLGYLGYLDRLGTRIFVNQGSGAGTGTVTADGGIALTKAASNLSEYSFGESLAEIGQTTQMISNRMLGIVSFINNVRRGAWNNGGMRRPSRSAQRTPGSKRMANHWLEFQYGWLPAIHDIWDLLEALNVGVARRGAKVRARSSHEVKSPFGGVAVARAGIDGHVSNAVLYNLNRWGLLNPYQLAWNLTSLSFAVDWFIPVARTLGAITAHAGVSLHNVWSTSCDLTVSGWNDGRSPGVRFPYTSTRHVVRSPQSVIIPTFWVTGGALNAGQLASAAALIRQRA